MKMRQYIAITDHILWDIITNGDQTTTELASSSGQPSAPKTSIVVNARRNNEKALNILLSAIPDRHLLSFHDAQDAQSLWAAIKARFGGNKESKKMQKNLLKQQFETFVVGAREELDSAYDRFQNIISMLELYDAKRTTWIRLIGIDDLITTLSTSRHSTADDKSKIKQPKASMPETHDDEDLLQIDDDAMEEIDIRWQVAMITARIRKFMRKTGRPIDLKPKNGITFDKANGSKEKRMVPIEDSNSKALVAKDSQGEIDWTKEFDDDPVTFAMVALNGIEEDDWSIEIDADHVDLGQDGLGVFDWSEEADNAPVALALMATSSTDSSNSEVPYCSNCSKSYKKLLNDYQTERDNFQRARLEIQGYQLSLESMRGDKTNISEFQGVQGGYVAFGNDPKGGRITGKGTIKTSCIDFENVSYVKELKFNLLSVSQISPRKNDVYSLNLKIIFPSGGVSRGLPLRPSKHDHSTSACRKGKQHKASCKKLEEKTVREPLELLHMDFFGPVSVESLNKKKYCLVKGIQRRIVLQGLLTKRCFAERKDRTLMRAARTSLADSLLTNSISGLKQYILLVIFMKPFGCPLTILNTMDHLSKFKGKSEEGYLLGYSTNSKGFRVYNRVTRKVQDCLHVDFLEDQMNQKGKEVPLTREDQDLQKEFENLMLQEISAHTHMENQGIASEKRKEKDTEEEIDLDLNNMDNTINGYRQEEGVDYDEVFAPVARIEAIRLFLAFASFMGFFVYQMDVKSAFCKAITHKRRGAIDKTLFIKRDRKDIMLVQVYVDDIIFGSTKTSMVKEFEELMQKEFTMSSMGELTFFLGLQVKQSTAGIFISQDKYVKDILNKFDFRTIKPATTPIEAHKALGKDEEGEDVDVHLYRSMIGCLMYLTASRPDIMFAVCLCARFQVTPKVSHMNAVKRIFRYLKHQPKLGLWYPKDSPFHLEAFSDSDYAGDNHDRRSTSGGCQYLGRRLVSWQCKKQTIVAISSTEAEYVAAASCCGQVLWMQNQLFDYGFNFMNTDIHIDNESTICIVKNHVFHSKTKHIQIRHHFIRDCYDQRLINVVKVHTDDNVADLLTKGFDLARFNSLVVNIGMMNP
ncbi:putative ribonuclease H-like domain-containing protein [Tanacetum coccineum]